MTSTIPRFLLPRGSKPLSPQYRSLFAQSRVQALRQTPICKYASTKTPKPRVLEKPDKFNPPSHPARLNKSPPRQFPGPPLSGAQKEAQMKKKYPHTMPPKDSFMNWFITNRSIHVWITLSTLSSLAIYTFTTNFQRTSPFAHLLPPANTFLSHPLNFLSQYIEVYKLHTAHISAETAERRRKKVDDVSKRSAYRKAHGLDKEQGFGGWMARGEGEESGTGMKVDGAVGSEIGGPTAAETGNSMSPVSSDSGAGDAVYRNLGGEKKPLKKWLGIW